MSSQRSLHFTAWATAVWAVALLTTSFACVQPTVRGRRIAASTQAQGPLRLVIVSKSGEDVQRLVESVLLDAQGSATATTNRANIQVVAGRAESMLQDERALLLSGDFADESLISYGQRIGAKVLVVAEEIVSEPSLFDYGNSRYGIRVTAIDIEKGVIIGFGEADALTQGVSSPIDPCDFACLRSRTTALALDELLGS